MKFYSAKNIRLKEVDVHLHYANNAGRGKDNVTVTFVPHRAVRPNYTREYHDDDILKQYRVSGWQGWVNVPTADIKFYGGVAEMVKERI